MARPYRHSALLLNTPDIELWPAAMCRTRASTTARRLAMSRVVLRRKRDGRLLAAAGPGELHPLVPTLWREPGLEAALAVLDALAARDPTASPLLRGSLPLAGVQADNTAIGLPDDYARSSGLPIHPEPRLLHAAGRDRWQRTLWLLAPTARAWQAMMAAARREAVVLEALSGYRSHAHQRGIIERKLARGLPLAAVLRINAAPGHSEHHSGRAIDIGTPGEPAAEESFTATPAFAWLQAHAGDFGFRLSYPHGNPYGIAYEPWHWCWHPPVG